MMSYSAGSGSVVAGGAAGPLVCPLRHTPVELREGGVVRMYVMCKCVW